MHNNIDGPSNEVKLADWVYCDGEWRGGAALMETPPHPVFTLHMFVSIRMCLKTETAGKRSNLNQVHVEEDGGVSSFTVVVPPRPR